MGFLDEYIKRGKNAAQARKDATEKARLLKQEEERIKTTSEKAQQEACIDYLVAFGQEKFDPLAQEMIVHGIESRFSSGSYPVSKKLYDWADENIRKIIDGPNSSENKFTVIGLAWYMDEGNEPSVVKVVATKAKSISYCKVVFELTSPNFSEKDPFITRDIEELKREIGEGFEKHFADK